VNINSLLNYTSLFISSENNKDSHKKKPDHPNDLANNFNSILPISLRS